MRRIHPYLGPVTKTVVNGFGDPESVGGQPPQCGIFYVRLRSRAPINHGGPGGAAARLAGANCRFANPAVWPATHHLAMIGGPQPQQLEAVMRHSSCLTHRSSEQTRSLNPQTQAAVALIRTAARDAVRAATPEQAADIAFGALVRLDGLFRMGVCHG